ncbi:3'-5' exonuclease [Chryseobacterium proteolyticum]
MLKRSLAKEEYRLFYVAVSRAKERLFISIPELAEVKQNSINHLFDSINT